MTTLRYGALVQAIGSLRGDFDNPVQPAEADVHYRAHLVSGIEPRADIYLPAQPAGAPSVVLVHGGAFVIGSRRTKPIRFLASRLCQAGIAVCAIDYRLIFRGGRIDEAVTDVIDAIAYWRRRAAELGVDRSRISVLGLSAGATLAMLATAQPAVEVARLACCFGLYDVEHLRGRVAELLPRLLFRTSDRGAWIDRTPLRAPQPEIPTLLLHGDSDGIVPVEQSRKLAALRDARGLPTKLVVYPGAPHGFFNQVCDARDSGLREIIEHVVAR